MKLERSTASPGHPDSSFMDSRQTHDWLLRQRLEMNAEWKADCPILMIIPEDVRDHFLDSNPDLPKPSFAIIRHPIGTETVNTPKGAKFKATLNPFGKREYDTYSVSDVTGMVRYGTTKFRKIGHDDEFVSDMPYLVINEKNKDILEKLGCKFDW